MTGPEGDAAKLIHQFQGYAVHTFPSNSEDAEGVPWPGSLCEVQVCMMVMAFH